MVCFFDDHITQTWESMDLTIFDRWVFANLEIHFRNPPPIYADVYYYNDTDNEKGVVVTADDPMFLTKWEKEMDGELPDPTVEIIGASDSG